MNPLPGNSQLPTANCQTTSVARAAGESIRCGVWSSALGVGLLCAALLVPATSTFAQGERISEIRVHGNHTTPDADVVALSGLTTGGDANPERLREAERALRESGRFEAVEIRRRYLSITDASQILLMIVVDEHPAVSDLDLTPGPMKKLGAASMWLPIVHHQDGYGLTYGARVSFNDVLGSSSRVSMPMTWGGERRVGVEAERLFDGPVSSVRAGASLYRRVNPHFQEPDTRREARVEAERRVTDWFRVGAGARIAAVKFGPDYEATHTAGGVHTVVDTRIDPSFPRNAIHARIAWERLAFPAARANRWLTDVRGYVGIGGSRVLALRGQLTQSNTALPFAEQTLLGGSDTLRGYATGYRAGDNMAAGTIEVRQPLNSPLSVGRFGVKAFVDAGTTWDAGRRMGDQPFDKGVGGGVYFGAGPFMMDLDIAKPEEGRVRAHFGMGVTF
jgi:outer membrane protein assembly factor BamA